jgi:hypothetical protein
MIIDSLPTADPARMCKSAQHVAQRGQYILDLRTWLLTFKILPGKPINCLFTISFGFISCQETLLCMCATAEEEKIERNLSTTHL